MELTPDKGVLEIGTVLSAGSYGKLVLATAGNENQAYGVLLETVDTSVKNPDGTVTASVDRKGSFKAEALTVGVGTDLSKLVPAFRQMDCFLEGLIVVPIAAQAPVTEPLGNPS